MKRLALLLSLSLAAPAAAEPPIRLYVLDCGHASLADGAPASDTGELDGKPLELADPCFLIVHPRGALLWDAGLPGEERRGPGFAAVPGPPLTEQLRALPRPALLAFSHLHFDHVGQASLFPDATWILNRDELAWAEAEPRHVSMEPALFATYKRAPTRLIEGDHDVFGDGRVRILHMPGHTPGSQALLVRLQSTAVLLSGDLYLRRESRQHWVPTVNADRAQTLASQARFERIAERLHARVIVQHDPRDYAALPRPPRYLQ
jgi:glyoxylase-like metal-dependent hydrolase (beta-lactamase superfamily II)